VNLLPGREGPPAGADARPAAIVIGSNEALGDALVRIPAYRALRVAFPAHRIVHVSGGATSMTDALVALAPQMVDEAIGWQPIKSGPAFMRRLIRSIGNVDVVIDLRSNLTAFWTYFATAGMPVRFIANTAFFGLRRGIPRGTEQRPKTNAQRYHRCVELVARRTLPFDPSAPVGDVARREAARLVPEGTRFMLLSPGLATSFKAWPAERWVTVARHLAGRAVRPVFLLGPVEPDHRTWIERDVPEAQIVDADDVADRADLPWLFHALASRSLGCVAIESGIGHLAATSGCPVLTICGPTKIAQWRPSTPRSWTADAREFGAREPGAVPAPTVIERIEEIIAYMDRLVPPAAFSRRAAAPASTVH
jgi:ADP-heptose:LPS heptosyltransferase